MGQKPSREPQRGVLVAIKRFPAILSKCEEMQQDLARTVPNLVTTARFASTLGAYYALIGTAGVILQWVHIGQTSELISGVKRIARAQEAKAALAVSARFAEAVYTKVRYEIDQTSLSKRENVFFVFNPDNIWHPGFYQLNKRQPLGHQFCGFSDDLPALCLWMRFVRILLADLKRKKPGRYNNNKKEVFHLIIPSYSAIRYENPIVFSEELYPLVIHGEVLFGNSQVQLNLPDSDQITLDRVGNLYKPPRFWESFQGPTKPILLGDIPASADRAAKEKLGRLRGRRRGT